MKPGPENNCSFPAHLYFTGPSILCRAEVSSKGEKEHWAAGEQRLALADELTRSGAAVMGLFWQRRKLRSRERKWLLRLCVFLYIGTHTTYQWASGTMKLQGQLALGRLQGGGQGDKGADYCRRDRWPWAAPQWGQLLVSCGYCSVLLLQPKRNKLVMHGFLVCASAGLQCPAERGTNNGTQVPPLPMQGIRLIESTPMEEI